MKELSIEEKAKRYDEAIERAKEINNEQRAQPFNVMTKVFPELKESEDERIRKKLIEAVKGDMVVGGTKDKQLAISWLEKQGEQKPNPCGNCGIATNNCQNFPCVIRDSEQKSTDKVEPKFRIGDIIKDTEDGEVFTIRTITKDKYIYTDDSFDWIKDQDEYELVEQKPTDEEMKELLHTEYEKGRADAIEEMQNPAWSEEDETKIKSIVALLKSPALCTMDGNKGIIDESIKYLKNLKDRVQPQTKQEWSEEDCNQIETIACHLDNIGNGAMAESLLNIMNKYKSLRPQNRWKPSDEQIEILDMVLTNESMDDNVARILRELREQLKKLREG